MENLSSSSDQVFFNKGKGASAVLENIKPDFTQSDRVTPIGEITLTPSTVHVRGALLFTSDVKSTNSGSEFREAKLVGEGGSEIRITLWNGKFDQVIDRISYHITNLITKSCNGLLLASIKKKQL